MVSRFDLYRKAGDEAVDDDPAYNYPDAPGVRSDVEGPYNRYTRDTSNFKPSEEPTVYKLRDELPDFLKKFYGEPGKLNLASAFQGFGKLLLPGQKALTPEDERNAIGVQLENAMAAKARERIAPQVEGTGRFAEQEIAAKVDKDIGGRQFSRTKNFLQKLQTPVLKSVEDLAEGRPIYDFSPIEATDIVFSVLDQIDVALGTKGILGGTAKVVRAGLSTATRNFLDLIERAPTSAAKEEIIRNDPKTAILLRDELKGGGFTPDGVARAPDDGTGSGGSASRSFELDENIFGNEYNSYMKLESKEKIQKYLQTIDKFKNNPNVSKDEFFKELGISANVMSHHINKYNKKAKNKLPPLSQNYKVTNKEADARMDKLRSDIESGVLNIEELKYKNTKDLAKEYGIDSKKITDEFPELKLDKQEQIKIAGQKSTQVRSQVVKDQIESMADYKRKNQDIKDLTTFPKLQAAMREDNLNPVKNWSSMADNTDDTTRQFLSPSLSTKRNPAIMNQVGQILSNYGLKDKGFVENDILKSYLVHSNRQNLDGLAKQLESYGLQTKDQFLKANPQLTELRNKTPNKFNKLYAQEMSDKYDDVVLDIIAQDIAINEPMNLIKFTNMRESQKILNKKIRTLLKNIFVDEKNNPALIKYRNEFLSKFNEATGKKYNLDNELVNKLMNVYGLQLSHTAPVRSKTKAIKGAGGFVDNIKLNLAGHNIAFQSSVENSIYKNFKEMKKLLKNNNLKELNNKVEDLKIVDEEFKKRGMSGYYKIDDPELISYLEKKGLDVGQAEKVNIPGVGEQRIQGDILFGTGESPSPEFLLNYLTNHFDEMIKDPEKIKFFLGTQGQKKLDESYKGVTTPIKKGVPYMNLKKPEMSTFNKGGPVRMAIGGDPLQNLNEQQFASDPATDDDFFKQAVQDENLMAFNPLNLFKVFKQTPAVSTPNKVVGSVATDAPTGTLPAATKIDMDDFPFQSHFINTISDRNIPSMDTPQGWKNLFGGTKGFSDAELKDSGILGYLEDAEKFLPGAKVSKEDLLKVYEKSPIANLEIKVKTEGFIPGEPEDFKIYTGSAQHQNMGNAEIDKGGTDYRNIVINVKEIPGQETAFYNRGHFDKDPNVIAFTRVANYKNTTGNDVAVIQELQTDLITNLRKEQERLNATVNAVRNKKQKLTESMERFPDDPYSKQQLDRLNAQYPEEKLRFLENTDLTRPSNPDFLEKLAPDLVRQLNDIQNQINKLTMDNVGVVRNPQYVNQIKELQDKGLSIFNDLFDLNRQKNFDDNLQDTFVSDIYRSEDLAEIGRGTNVPADRPVESYGQIPFIKGPDWIDLMLKATIQDAQSRGINKVAIMPSDVVNKRWNKDVDGSAGEKFQTIYDKISVQELKNIAKKYTGNKANLQIEEIVDPNKGQQGFRVLEKGVDGKYENLRELDPNTTFPNRGPEDTSNYNYDILKLAQNYNFGEIIIRKEIAPGQSMDYAIKINKAPVDKETGLNFNIDVEDTFDLVPAKEDVNPLVVIEEFNPSVTKMYVLTLPEETTKKGPMFLFRKKDGGKIKSDGLVSITDIYGDY